MKPGFEIAPSMKPKHDWLAERTCNVATPVLSVVALALATSPGQLPVAGTPGAGLPSWSLTVALAVATFSPLEPVTSTTGRSATTAAGQYVRTWFVTGS